MTEPGRRGLLFLLLALIPAQRLLLALAQPDLLHDLDPGELKHMDLALLGLPQGESLADRLRTFLSGPENIHHGGYPVVSALYLLGSKLFGHSLFLLRVIPTVATTVAALCMALLLHRRAGPRAAWVALALMVGAPPLLLKWTTTSRGGHLEGILFPMLLALLLDRALRGGLGRWLVAGLAGGFAVYFSYLAAPAVVLLSLGALSERALCDRRGALKATVVLGLGGLIGFAPWLVGLLVLDLPYLDASIHQTSNPTEAAEVQARTIGATLQAVRDGIEHNLWPWGIATSSEAAYTSSTPDILVFEATTTTWLLRAAVSAAVIGGGVYAVGARSPLLVALCLLPAAHHVFVLRAANTVGWPDVPHRYLVIVFPAIAAAAGLAAAHKRAGVIFVALVSAVATLGLASQASWYGPPKTAQFSDWDVASLRAAGLGQVRVEQGEAVAELLSVRGEDADTFRRGVALVYPAISDYYLLFRPTAGAAPYPDQLFREGDPLSQNDPHRRALVQGALAATQARTDDPDQLAAWLCSWGSHPEFDAHVAEARATAGVSCAR